MPQTIIPLKFWIVLILGAFVLSSQMANAAPFAQAEADGARIVLHNDKCTLKEVENLAKHATWEEKGKVYVGCWGAHPVLPFVLAYFNDKTVVAIPKELFQKVTGV